MNIDSSCRFFRLLLSSFNGCMLGGILGDIYGRPFEGSSSCTKEDVTRYFQKESVRSKGNALNRYSDDTVMTMDIIRSLTKYPNFNPGDMANNFANSCMYSFVGRYYGASVTIVFEKWITSNFRDLWIPAEQQFEGNGSFGNGAAMRVSPVGLLFLTQSQDTTDTKLGKVVDLAIKTSLLTHTHPLGIGGGVFQAISIRNTLQCRIEADLKKCSESKSMFLQILDGIEGDLKSLKALETMKIDLDSSNAKVIDAGAMYSPYLDKLIVVRQLLESKDGLVNNDLVVSKLGNGIAALESVPTALYCFLKTLKEHDQDKTELFKKTLQFAISLGGDADTIASMAGSLAGAFVGEEEIPQNLQTNAEGVAEIRKLSQQLFDQFYNLNPGGSISKV